MHMKHKKGIAILLTLAMLFSILPMSALAETTDSTVAQSDTGNQILQSGLLLVKMVIKFCVVQSILYCHNSFFQYYELVKR